MDTLPGLDRLMKTCRRLNLSLKTSPPPQPPPVTGTLVDGQPLDPLLAAFYRQAGEASFATDKAGIMIAPWGGSVEYNLEAENQRWRGLLQGHLPLPVLIFAGEPHTIYRYATLPGLADEQGRQPVVHLDMYEDPHALPVASTVDRFFELYARYLEELVSTPGYEEDGEAALTFPWQVPHLLTEDRQLIQLIRAGCFDPIMQKTGATPKWIAQALEAAARSLH